MSINRTCVKFYSRGFTLLEILIGLFIFTMLSMIMGTALRQVIQTHSRTEESAARLRHVQMALLILARDIEQAVNRPAFNTKGVEEQAFVGDPRSFTFTHMHAGNSFTEQLQSDLQRVRYYWEKTTLWRSTWTALDLPQDAKPALRPLLDHLVEVRFQYLDQQGYVHHQWPVQGKENQVLPRAVSVNINIENWGKMSQLYVIAADAAKNNSQVFKDE